MVRKSCLGFTLSELLIAFSIVGILSVIALPNLQGTRDQLKVSEDARTIALILTELRAESIRLKRNTVITFSSNGIAWDFFNDGSIDGEYQLAEGVTWQQIPNPMTINGFGLVRAASQDLSLTVSAKQSRSTITVNMNGHVSL